MGIDWSTSIVASVVTSFNEALRVLSLLMYTSASEAKIYELSYTLDSTSRTNHVRQARKCYCQHVLLVEVPGAARDMVPPAEAVPKPEVTLQEHDGMSCRLPAAIVVS